MEAMGVRRSVLWGRIAFEAVSLAIGIAALAFVACAVVAAISGGIR